MLEYQLNAVFLLRAGVCRKLKSKRNEHVYVHINYVVDVLVVPAAIKKNENI